MPGVNAAQLMVTVGANTAAAEQGIAGFARLLGPGGILGLGALGAGAAIIGIGAASTKMAGDFQAGMVSIVTGAGELQSNLQLVSDGVLQMARDTGTSTKQLTDGLYMIESANIHGAAAIDLLRVAAEGAKVGNADLGVTAQVVTGIMKDYGLKATDGAMAMNTVIATVSNGQTHMQDLATSLSSVLPTAAAAGVSLTDVMGAMAAQTAHMVPAADAATHLRQLIISLEAPSSAAKKALEGVGLSTDQVAAEMKTSLPGALQLIQQHVAQMYGEGSPQYVEAMKNISGGMREMQGMLLLTSKTGMADFQADVGKITDAVNKGGNQITGWNLVQDTFNQKMSRAGERVKTFMIQLGEKLLPIAGQVADAFSKNLGPAISTVGDFFKTDLLPMANQGLAVFNLLQPSLNSLAKGFGGDLLSAVKQLGTFWKETLWPAILNFSVFFVQNVLPVVKTFADVLVKNVLPAILPVVKTIVEKWLPPMERIAKDILPVLNPLLQGLGWLFQNVIGPGLNLMAGAIGGVLGGIADFADAITNFMQNPSTSKFMDLLKGAASLGNSGLNLMTGGLLSKFPHFADGGQMDASGLALVGERGPELVQLPGGAQVTPLGGRSGMGGLGVSGLPASAGGGLGGPITIVVQSRLDGRLVAENQVKYIPQAIRNATGTRGF